VAQRIAIVEDHGMIAHTVATALTAIGIEVVVIDPAEGDVVERTLAFLPSLILLDLDLGPAGDGTDLISALRRDATPVLMVTGVTDPIRHARCLAAGAAGVVTKAASFDELMAAITQVRENGTLVAKHERDEALALLRLHEAERKRLLAPFESLSRREAEVLGELIHGASVEQIARDAVVSIATVRTQIRAILRKLEAPSQVSAISRARDAGWVPPQER
jgi:two-component system, NarL family, nitrate/nitrite response regulator NarL